MIVNKLLLKKRLENLRIIEIHYEIYRYSKMSTLCDVILLFWKKKSVGLEIKALKGNEPLAGYMGVEQVLDGKTSRLTE